MWFKNIRVLNLQEPLSYKPDDIAERLKPMAFRPCPKSLPFSLGWASPLNTQDEEAPLVYANNGFIMLCLKIEEKVIPPAVVRERLQDRVKEIENVSGRKVSKDEKEQLKEDTYQSLLSQAFTKSSFIWAYIDTRQNYVVVNTTSKKRLNQFTTQFNKCVGTTVYFPKILAVPPILTTWISHHDNPSAFSIDQSCVLKSFTEEQGTARFKHHDLHSNQVRAFLNDSSLVIQLALTWADQIQFTLREDLSITSIKFLETIKDLSKDGLGETHEERFATDFIIMAETLQRFFLDFLPAFIDESESEETATPEITAASTQH